MLKGDLTSTPLAPLMLQLSEDAATGCLYVCDTAGEEALVYYKDGLVYSVSAPGSRPRLGAKLVSSGALSPDALADALETQRTELQGWRLGELLVHLGYVDQPVVEAFVKEQVHDAVWDLIRWAPDGQWKFRRNGKTREHVAPPMPVSDLLADLRERGLEWEAISAIMHGPSAVPVLSTRGDGAPETTLDADAWSMLCKIDGERSVAELARDCGYTMFEAGRVLVTLVNAGLLDIEEDVDTFGSDNPAAEFDEDAWYGATSVSSALHADAGAVVAADDDEPQDAFAALARLVTEVAATVLDDAPAGEAAPESLSQVSLRPTADLSFATSIARVSEALSDALGPQTTIDDPFEVPTHLRRKRTRKSAPAQPVSTPETERKSRTRAAAAAELAAAHALAEALRSAQADESMSSLEIVDFTESQETAEIVDLAVVRREAEAAARIEAERLAVEEAARVEAERLAAEEARLAAEQEAARLAAEEEAARVEAERLAAEEAARVEAERLAAEEAARLAAEEAARAEAERLAAEEARLAAEQEAARLAAEEEAARVEAERLAAEEAARAEAERLAAEEARLAAEQEAARLAAEEEAARVEAERLAAEEAARLAAEQEAAQLETERLAAEEAARVEAERLAAEQEAARVEAERLAAEEAARLAAEQEAARLETERLAAEEAARVEAERLAAEQEAARAETERLAAEVAAAADMAWSEYWQRDADTKAAAARHQEATALLVELSAAPIQEPQPVVFAAAEDDQAEPDAEADDMREPATVAAGYFGGSASGEVADTAALLRELSSLGMDDDAPAARTPTPRAPQRQSPAAVDPRKKKRGLFGR